MIELARDSKGNPELPEWLKDGYEAALTELAGLGLAELARVEDPEAIRSILGLLAIWKGARTYGRILIDFSEDEVIELEQEALGASDSSDG